MIELTNATDYGLPAGRYHPTICGKAFDLAFGLDSGLAHLKDCSVSDELLLVMALRARFSPVSRPSQVGGQHQLSSAVRICRTTSYLL
jgi:hypothetical protein